MRTISLFGHDTNHISTTQRAEPFGDVSDMYPQEAMSPTSQIHHDSLLTVSWKAWCCHNEQVGCSSSGHIMAKFDCVDGYSNWQRHISGQITLHIVEGIQKGSQRCQKVENRSLLSCVSDFFSKVSSHRDLETEKRCYLQSRLRLQGMVI